MKKSNLILTLSFIIFTLLVFSSTLLNAQDTPSPALLVGEKSGGLLSIIDPGSLEIVSRVPANPNPHEVATDGRYAYISNSGAGSITVIDLQSRELVEGIDLSPLSPIHGLQFASGNLIFANERSRTIGKYNPESGEIEWVLGTGLQQSHMIVVNEDASKFFTTNMGPGTASIIEQNEGGNWEIRTIPTGQRAEGLALSPDETEFWVTNVHDSNISIIDVDSWQVADTIELPTSFSNRLKFSPDGRYVIVADLRGTEVLIIDPETRSIINHVDVGGGSEGLLFTPDGSKAFIAVSTANKVAVLDMETLTIIGEIHDLNNPDGMAWAVAP
jgi:DNA-binding beta-propeller fold protein YncE